MTTTAVSDRVLTLPNAISLARLLCVPVFAVLIVTGRDVAALVLLVLAGVSDHVDGVLARRWDQVTRLGQLLDPAADRLYLAAALLGLAWREIVPWWLVLLLVGRDVVLSLNVLVLRHHGLSSLPPHLIGKIATFVLLTALPLLLLAETVGDVPGVPGAAAVVRPVAWALVLWGTGLYYWAAAGYLRQTAVLVRRQRRLRG
jgi:cardiolipin synthase (CMP-forming)